MIWRSIVRFDDYECNASGEIRRKRMYGYPDRPGVKLKAAIGPHGYLLVSLRRDGRTHSILVHRIICETFHGICPDGKEEVAHNDGVRTNNNSSNLRWATRKENRRDMIAHGTYFQGQQHPLARLTEIDVLCIRRTVDKAPSRYGLFRRLAKLYSVSHYTIEDIVYGRSWKHLQELS